MKDLRRKLQKTTARKEKAKEREAESPTDVRWYEKKRRSRWVEGRQDFANVRAAWPSKGDSEKASESTV